MKKRNLVRYLESLRLSEVLSALFMSFLTCIGFILAHKEINWLIILTVFIAILAKSIRDTFDKKNFNSIKNKKVSFSQASRSLFLILLWVLSILLSFRLSMFSMYQGILLMIFVDIAIFSLYVKNLFPGASIIVSVLINTLPLLFAFDVNDITTWKTMFFSLFIFCITIAREILEDIEHQDADKGYKKTLATENVLNEEGMLVLTGMFIILGLVPFAFLLFNEGVFLKALVMISYLIFLFVAVSFFYFNYYRSIQKMFLDLGIIIILFALWVVPLLVK